MNLLNTIETVNTLEELMTVSESARIGRRNFWFALNVGGRVVDWFEARKLEN